MTYQEAVAQELNGEKGTLRLIINKLKELSGKRVLYYTHDDPDGITSALLMTKIFSKLKIAYDMFMPESYELERFRIEEAVAKSKKPYAAMVVTDKGTQGRMDTYTDLIQDIIIIDHHFMQGTPAKCLLFHPQAFCSCSHLVHMLLTALDLRDDYDDFINLVGLKGDWVIDPVRDFSSDYVKPFVDEAKKTYPGLFKKAKGDTWFDIKQDGTTCVLSQILEFIHGLCGGGFQYFYNDRDKSLANINQPELTMKLLASLRSKLTAVKKVTGLPAFFKLIPERKICLKIWDYYHQDWDRARTLMDSAVPIATYGGDPMFLFIGNQIPLIPMLGSVKTTELCRRYGLAKAALVMVNYEKKGSVHFSLRAMMGNNVHVGKLCNNLATALGKRYNDTDTITGGGHPTAGECKVRRTDVPLRVCLQEFMAMIERMDEYSRKENLTPADRETALSLGLDYLKA